jgi:hypothetical protein
MEMVKGKVRKQYSGAGSVQIITDPDQDPDSPKRFRSGSRTLKGRKKKRKEDKGRKKKVSKRQEKRGKKGKERKRKGRKDKRKGGKES